MGKREDFYRQNGFSTERIEDLREKERDIKDIIRRNERDRMGQWLEQKIRKSKYNDRYKNSTSIVMPDYLLKKGEGESQKMITRWRCGNEEERNGFWKTGGEKMPICRVEEGCIEHIMPHTRIKIGVGEVLDERGKRETVKGMREVKKLRYIGGG